MEVYFLKIEERQGDDIGLGFRHEDHSKHENCEKVVHGEHRSQRLPRSVVIGQDSIQHGTKRNGH